MTERIDTLTIDQEELTNEPFFNGPAEFLVHVVVQRLREDSLWGPLFGVSESDAQGFLDDYRREDYPERALPALRIYNENYTKQFESWFIEGDLIADVIFPASLRRTQLQQYQDTISSALLQQFRRPNFFAEVLELVPGLNELGKRFDVDKSLGFAWGEDAVPLTQLRVNFRIDLRKWDDYLEQTNRTKSSPYRPVLADLTRIVSEIQALREGVEDPEVTITVDQKIDP